MKKTFLSLGFSIALLLAGCGKDTLITPTDPSEGSSEEQWADLIFSDTVDVVFSGTTATVSGVGDSLTYVLSDGQVTFTNSGSGIVLYRLSGSTTDGFFKVYSMAPQAIVLNSVNIANTGGAAINVQGPTASPADGQCTYVVVNGTNTLADGSSYTQTPTVEDEKAALFSEGPLVFSGNGLLTVTATGKAGITSDEYLRLSGSPTITVRSSAGHGLRGKDSILVEGGTLDVTVSANMKKGLTSDSLVRFDGGTATIKVSGSAAYDSQEGDYSGTAGVKVNGRFVMNDGSLTLTNSGTGGKGISGGTAVFSGGTVSITTTGANYTTGDVSAKGIKFDGAIVFSGSHVSVKCSASEGIESKGAITISGGQVYSYSVADDAINSAGDMTITGGFVGAHSASNDGLDANGNCYIQGGVVYAIGASGAEMAIDANSEEGKKLYVTGGTIVAIGGLERGASLSQSCYQASSWSANTWYALTDGTTTYAFQTPASTGSSGGGPGGNSSSALVVSMSGTSGVPTLLSGIGTPTAGSYYFDNTFVANPTYTGGSMVSLSTYTGNSGGGPGHSRQ